MAYTGLGEMWSLPEALRPAAHFVSRFNVVDRSVDPTLAGTVRVIQNS
jgi:hypothetical protein